MDALLGKGSRVETRVGPTHVTSQGLVEQSMPLDSVEGRDTPLVQLPDNI